MKVAASLTPKQLKILGLIRQYIREKGVSPTMDELAAMTDVCRITVFEHINALEKKGWITRSKYRARAIRLIETCSECGRRVADMTVRLGDDQHLAESYGRWLAGDEGRSCKAGISGISVEQKLKAVFEAGWKAARQAVEQRDEVLAEAG